MSNILYIGMADDIVSPLLLCPDFDTLFVIDGFDDAYSEDGTFEGQKKYIVDSLIAGHSKYRMRSDGCDILYHPIYIGKATIVSNIDTNIIRDNKVVSGIWTLKFEWNGKIRTLIRYEMNACQEIWPVEITNINHIITIGSINWDDVVQYYCRVNIDRNDFDGTDPDVEQDPNREGIYQKYIPDLTEQFRSMIRNRTVLPFKWTQLAFTNTSLPSTMLRNGRGTYAMIKYNSQSVEMNISDLLLMNENALDSNIGHGWEKIATITIDSFEGDWYTKYSRYAKI